MSARSLAASVFGYSDECCKIRNQYEQNGEVLPQLLNVPDPSEMFLNPGLASGKGKKPYLIPDFVSSKVVQDEDSSTIHLGENAKLSIVYRQNKPKLSDVTLSEWNAANMHILYKLIETKTTSHI